MYDVWLKKASNLGHKYLYCSEKPISHPYIFPNYSIYNFSTALNNNLPEGRKSFSENKDREIKRLTLARYFLEKTDALFFVNPTDDVFLDVHNIKKWASELSMRYNTINDIAVLGNCLYHHPHIYLQGGTGYIFTRAAAKIFVDNGERWLTESYLADDLESARFLSYMNLTTSGCASPYMIGHGLEMLKFKKAYTRYFPICPKNFYEPQCKQGLLPIKKAMMLHYSNVKDGLVAWKTFLELKRSKVKYMWYNKYPRNFICRMGYPYVK